MKLELDKINLTPKTLEEAAETIGHLVKIIIELKKENDSLREQLNNNSNNSSLPPSRDLKKKKKISVKSGRKKGGQPGHKSWQRSIVPAEEVDAIVDCKPAEICECGGAIELKEKVEIHQVYEIPLPQYEVTEYRIYKGCCTACHIKHNGQLPTGTSRKGFGIRTQAMLSLLTSKYRLSKRLVQSWFQDVYQMPICLGSVSNVEQTVSQSLKVIHEEVFSAVQAEKIIHVDETGHKECNKSGWAWIASAPQYTYFMLHKSRGKKIAKEIIGDPQGRMIISDRYSAYNYLPSENHQICWAHLKRDFQKIADRPDKPGRIGTNLLKCYRLLFGFWKTAYKQEAELCKKQKKRLRRFKNRMLRWLVIGTECGHDKTARTCENILGYQRSLWHFFDNQQISPTNNHAERQLRPLVISKKLTFGTQSNRGSRYIERIFTVLTSCKQQGRDVFAFVTEAVQNSFAGKAAPSLL
jgi:transposase